MSKYLRNQINQIVLQLWEIEIFTCLHQKQPESWEIFTLLKGRDDCPTLKFHLSCSSLVCWRRLCLHFIIHENHSRREFHPGGDTTKVLNADKTNTCLHVLQQILYNIINIHLNLTCLGVLQLWLWDPEHFGRDSEGRLLLRLGTYVRSETFGSFLTLSERDGGHLVMLLHDSSRFYVIVFCPALSFLPSAPDHLPLQLNRQGPAVWAGAGCLYSWLVHTNNLLYEKQTFCYRRCKKQIEATLQDSDFNF